MADEVAQKIEADIILPKSAVKPEYKGGLVRSLRSLLGDQQAHSCRGPLVLGIRDVSRELQFKSSYTVVEHTPEESIELEIERHALEQIEKLQAAARDGDFTELFRLLGTSEAESVSHGLVVMEISFPLLVRAARPSLAKPVRADRQL